MSQDLIVREQNLLSSDVLAELGRQALEAHERVRDCALEAVANMVRAGEMLCKARDLCDARQFQRFISDHFRGKRRTAQTYMKLARNWPTVQAAAPPDALTSQRKALRILDGILANLDPSNETPRRRKRHSPTTTELTTAEPATPIGTDAAECGFVAPPEKAAASVDDELRRAVFRMYQETLRMLAELSNELIRVTPEPYAVDKAVQLIDETRSKLKKRGRKLFAVEAISGVPR